jgi:hypothetical protein
VALSGTIETFALPDVLRLLASTKKTGCLRLDGSRGTGAIWVADGAIVGGEANGAPHADGPGEVLFELLRFTEGDFEFDADSAPPSTTSPADVEPTLAAAEAMLDEWKGIEAVVPSLDHWVALSPDLPAEEVTISAARWKTLVAVAGGTSVGRLGDALSLGELPISRSVKELVELGLVHVDEPRDEAAAPAPPPAAPVMTEVADLAAETVPTPPPPAEEATEDVFDPNGLVIEEPPIPSSAASSSSPPPAAPDASDAAEIARQLANLSPKAAKAVAAAAKATTPEEREAALAEVDDEEDPINRDLLIKFLGSVSS